MILFIILIGLFWPSVVFATPQISIINYPNSVVVGDTFPVSFNVFSAEIGTIYYYKFFGGIGDTKTYIQTGQKLYYTGTSWSEFPSFNIDIGGSAFIETTAFINSDKPDGIYNFYLKIKDGLTSSVKTINVVFPEPTPILAITPEPTLSAATPVVSPEPAAKADLIITEIMANSNVGESEWVEIYNPNNQNIPLKDLCFYDDTLKSPHCFSDNEFISPNSYYSKSFSSGFLNNDGDTLTFLNTPITYPKSAKNLTYSLQPDNSWCFASSSQNAKNNLCIIANISTDSEDKYSLPQLNLIFSPESVVAGEDFNLVFSLKSADPYSLRLIFPFGSQYFPFSDFKNGYSWLTIPLSVSKKLPQGEYPLSFHLKKADSSHLYDYQIGNINVTAPIVTPKVSKSKVLGASTYSCPTCLDNSASLNYYPASTLGEVKPDTNIFSWPFLFAGSILFLSPILFPKLYSV